jgi:hypothetical protein
MSTLREVIHENVRWGELYEKLTATGCGVLPVGTVERSQTASLGFAKFATTGVEPCMCLGAMSAASNATR